MTTEPDMRDTGLDIRAEVLQRIGSDRTLAAASKAMAEVFHEAVTSGKLRLDSLCAAAALASTYPSDGFQFDPRRPPPDYAALYERLRDMVVECIRLWVKHGADLIKRGEATKKSALVGQGKALQQAALALQGGLQLLDGREVEVPQ